MLRRRSQSFQNEVSARGRGADRISKWWLSIDPCAMSVLCNFIQGLKRGASDWRGYKKLFYDHGIDPGLTVYLSKLAMK